MTGNCEQTSKDKVASIVVESEERAQSMCRRRRLLAAAIAAISRVTSHPDINVEIAQRYMSFQKLNFCFFVDLDTRIKSVSLGSTIVLKLLTALFLFLTFPNAAHSNGLNAPGIITEAEIIRKFEKTPPGNIATTSYSPDQSSFRSYFVEYEHTTEMGQRTTKGKEKMTDDFETFYKANIAPMVEEAEAQVRSLRGNRLPLAAAVAAIWFIAAGAGIYALHKGQPLAVLIGLGVFALVGGLILFGAISRDGSANFAKEFAQKTAALLAEKSFEGKFTATPDQDHVNYRAFSDLGGFQKLVKPKLIYGLSGTQNGRSFRMVHAFSSSQGTYSSSQKMSGNDRHTVSFDGIILEVDLPAPTPTIIIWERDQLKDLLSKAPGGAAFQNLANDDLAFDERYQIRTDDPDRAKAFITPEFMRAFAALKTDLFSSSDTISAALLDGKFYLSATRFGRNPLSDLEPQLALESVLSYEERAARAYDELSLPIRILDRLPLGTRG